MSAERIERLRELVASEGLDAVIVGGLLRPGDSSLQEMVNLRWLTGFTGTSGAIVVGVEKPVFVTDFRYAERAAADFGDGVELEVAGQKLLAALAARLHGRVGFDDANVSVRSLRILEEDLVDGVELVPAAGLVEQLRRRKDAAELAAIAAAAKLADEVFEWIAEAGVAGKTEADVARAAVGRIRELGGEPSFPPIVAAGPNGAIPHHEPSDRAIGPGELVVIDMGAELDGYCSDCTRTFASGELDAQAAEVYEVVRSAQAAALDAVAPGVTAVASDAAARDPIDEAGYGEHFGHGLGHGVGMEVHERPRLAKTSEDVIELGDVVTVEPGIYLPGKFGVRIEDLVSVTEGGNHNLSRVSKELTVVG